MGVRDHWGYSGYNTTEISEKNETQKNLTCVQLQM